MKPRLSLVLFALKWPFRRTEGRIYDTLSADTYIRTCRCCFPTPAPVEHAVYVYTGYINVDFKVHVFPRLSSLSLSLPFDPLATDERFYFSTTTRLRAPWLYMYVFFVQKSLGTLRNSARAGGFYCLSFRNSHRAVLCICITRRNMQPQTVSVGLERGQGGSSGCEVLEQRHDQSIRVVSKWKLPRDREASLVRKVDRNIVTCK